MSEKEIPPEELYEDFRHVADLLKEILDKVVEVGDLETLLEIEHLLNEKEEYARQRDVTKKINEKIESTNALEPIKGDE